MGGLCPPFALFPASFSRYFLRAICHFPRPPGLFATTTHRPSTYARLAQNTAALCPCPFFRRHCSATLLQSISISMAFNLFFYASRPHFSAALHPRHFLCWPLFSANAFFCLPALRLWRRQPIKNNKGVHPKASATLCGGFRMNAFVHGKSIAPTAFLVNKPAVKKL